MYITSRQHEERNIKRKQEGGQRREKGKNKRRDIIYSWKITTKQSQLSNCIIECKSTAIEL